MREVVTKTDVALCGIMDTVTIMSAGMDEDERPPLHEWKGKIALVLGAGGPVGHAFHAGVLRGLSTARDWDPRQADLIVGTSAGAQVAALLRAGMGPDDLAARVTGEPMSAHGGHLARHFVRPDYGEPHHPRSFRPASVRYLAKSVVRPWQANPGSILSAFLPRGRVSLHVMAEGLRGLFGVEWPKQPLWVPALQLHTGRRVVFGRSGDPRADVGSAVASSGAVPGVVAPVEIGDHHYADGGMISLTNVDLIPVETYDWVIVSSPLSRYSLLRWRLRRRLQRLRQAGTRVVVIEPGRAVVRAMGPNPMNAARAPGVANLAFEEMKEKHS